MCAIRSLPVPVSPKIKTVPLCLATRSTMPMNLRMTSLATIKGLGAGLLEFVNVAFPPQQTQGFVRTSGASVRAIRQEWHRDLFRSSVRHHMYGHLSNETK